MMASIRLRSLQQLQRINMTLVGVALAAMLYLLVCAFYSKLLLLLPYGWVIPLLGLAVGFLALGLLCVTSRSMDKRLHKQWFLTRNMWRIGLIANFPIILWAIVTLSLAPAPWYGIWTVEVVLILEFGTIGMVAFALWLTRGFVDEPNDEYWIRRFDCSIHDFRVSIGPFLQEMGLTIEDDDKPSSGIPALLYVTSGKDEDEQLVSEVASTKADGVSVKVYSDPPAERLKAMMEKAAAKARFTKALSPATLSSK